MAKGSKRSPSDIQQLLDEKRQIEQWLQRLAMAADQTPDQVRDKVQSDYRKRHEAILEELQGFKGELSLALEQQREARDDLAKREAEASERLAEAELRHTVGEFDEERWSELRTEILESLVKIREELKAAEEEISSVEEVMVSVDGTEAQEALPPEVTEEVTAAAAAEEAEAEPAQTDAFDELEFLRSVTNDEAGKPRPRLSGQQPRVSTSDLASPLEDTPVPGGEPTPPSELMPPGERKSQVGAEGVEALETKQNRPAHGSAKTVKCGECGAPNLPTEWYCERCGAELAAL
jgi:hypothetical protein